jgi:hypothetical protein
VIGSRRGIVTREFAAGVRLELCAKGEAVCLPLPLLHLERPDAEILLEFARMIR